MSFEYHNFSISQLRSFFFLHMIHMYIVLHCMCASFVYTRRPHRVETNPVSLAKKKKMQQLAQTEYSYGTRKKHQQADRRAGDLRDGEV